MANPVMFILAIGWLLLVVTFIFIFSFEKHPFPFYVLGDIRN